MKYSTPLIAWHDKRPVYSVDIDPVPVRRDQESIVYRLVTGGHDSKINVWHIRILEVADLDQKKPVDNIECVSELSVHRVPVNVVRFAPLPKQPNDPTVERTSPLKSLDNENEHLFASGDDEACIYIWKLCEDEDDSTKPVISDFGENVISIETWRIHKTLTGHTRNVSDLTWSASGHQIVSSSVDKNVFVWDVAKGCKIRKLQKEHAGFVLGVAYDPFERYIASLSDNRILLIFNAMNGKTLHQIDRNNNSEAEENNNKSVLNDDNNSNNTKISDTSTVVDNNAKDKNKKPKYIFHDQNMNSFCRRLTFTPCGEFLIVPSGIIEKDVKNEFINGIYVFSRKSLDKPCFFLPTQKPSFVVRCCPVLFELRKENTNNIMGLPYRIVFACSTQNAVHFYDSQQSSPFAYISQIHHFRLTDISWSSDGRFLILTSCDGFTSFVVFDHGELGTPYTGPRLTFEDLEPLPIIPRKSKKPQELKKKEEKENNDDGCSPAKAMPDKKKRASISVRQEITKRTLAKKVDKSTPPKTQEITRFFPKIQTPNYGDRSASLASSSSLGQPDTPATKSNPNSPSTGTPKSGTDAGKLEMKTARRVSLITLFTAKKTVGTTKPTTGGSLSQMIKVNSDEDVPQPMEEDDDDSVEFLGEKKIDPSYI